VRGVHYSKPRLEQVEEHVDEIGKERELQRVDQELSAVE